MHHQVTSVKPIGFANLLSDHFSKLLEPMLSKVFSKVLVNEQHGFSD